MPAQESSYDFRTTGVSDGPFDRLGPGHASGAQATTRPVDADAKPRNAKTIKTPAKNGAGATA